MDQQTRMFRVLVCLAVSMTAGSVLLAWLEPRSPEVAHLVTTERCAAVAQAAVASCPSPSLRLDWDAITLIPVEGGSDRLTLAALRSQEPVHFVVSRAGEIVSDPAWRDQLRVSGLREIRIGLRSSGSTDAIGLTQRVAILALIDELNRTVPHAEAGPSLPVHFVRETENAAFARAVRHVLDGHQPAQS